MELLYRVAGSRLREGREVAVRDDEGGQGQHVHGEDPGQKAGQIVRFRIKRDRCEGRRTARSRNPNDLRPALSVYVHDKFEPAKVPFGLIINVGPRRSSAPPARTAAAALRRTARRPTPAGPRQVGVRLRRSEDGRAANCSTSSTSRRAGGGRKVRFHKDHPLDGMTTINLIYEVRTASSLAEPLAYEVYRKAGNAACEPISSAPGSTAGRIGYQLLIEQPNKSFLRHNGLRPTATCTSASGSAATWSASTRRRRTPTTGTTTWSSWSSELNQTKGDEQWEVIKKNFDVEQVVNYFAVNMVLSHWDGYFNNYFTYHDVHGTGKWTMYPVGPGQDLGLPRRHPRLRGVLRHAADVRHGGRPAAGLAGRPASAAAADLVAARRRLLAGRCWPTRSSASSSSRAPRRLLENGLHRRRCSSR